MNPINFTRAWFWYVLASAVVLLDQLSKFWATTHLGYAEPLTLAPFFNFTLLHNHGAAFSFLAEQDGWQRWFFTLLAIAMSAVLIVWIARAARVNKVESGAFALILGGALGNLCDRIHLGYVVDFIVVHYQEHFWPAFNLADSAITLGAFLLIIQILFKKKEKEVHA